MLFMVLSLRLSWAQPEFTKINKNELAQFKMRFKGLVVYNRLFNDLTSVFMNVI